MRIPEGFYTLIGDWHGPGALWFDPSQPPHATFDATASVSSAARDNLLSVSYTWSIDGEEQQGIILLGENVETKALEASWVDSWHMANSFMISKGERTNTATASVLGSYAAPEGPDWGWRTTFEAVSASEWHLRMYNIMPGSPDEMLSFELRFTR